MNDKNVIVRTLTFEETLTIVFITLKLCGVIDWSWWWVISPIYVKFACWIGAFVYAARSR